MDFRTGHKEFDGGFYTLTYPVNYSFINEGGGQAIGFALIPGTIGVLRLSVMPQESSEICEGLFENIINNSSYQVIDINGHRSFFFVEQKQFGSNDPLFYSEATPMSMYFYCCRINEHLFWFSYRLPEYMEDDGKFDGEHPIVMKIIGSLKLK